MLFSDSLTLDAPKRTKEGFLAVRAKAARAGIYEYLGREIDPTGSHFASDQIVRVWRSPEEVFNRDSVHSFLLKPVTDDHPSVPVTMDNWRQHARGVNAGAMRDGDFLAFDLVLMDRSAIDAVDSGKRELSNGYTSELDFTPGVTADGKPYDAQQRNIRGNHIAIVKAGRAGPQCRIGDAAICDSIDISVMERLLADGQTYRDAPTRDNFQSNDDRGSRGSKQMKTITIDSIPFELDDQAAAAVGKLQSSIADAITRATKAESDVATLTTQLATKDAELVTAKKQLEDSKLSPQQLRDAAKAYQQTVDKAKALGVNVTDVMSEADIIKTAVLAKVGDAAKDWNDAQLAASFATLSTDAKGGIDPVRQALGSGAATVVSDTATIRDAARASRYAPAN
jgi:hypothetical protein